MYEIKSRRLRSTFADIDFFPSFFFKENHVLDNPSEKIVIIKEELDGIDTDDIGFTKNSVHP